MFKREIQNELEICDCEFSNWFLVPSGRARECLKCGKIDYYFDKKVSQNGLNQQSGVL